MNGLGQYFNKKMLVLTILGLASGLPLGLTMGTLQAWYTVEGVDLVTIGFLGLVGQPYVYKFLWSPVMDRYVPKGGRRRGWLILCQAALVVTLLVMSQFSPSEAPVMLGFLALALAFFSASQDVCADAYRTERLTPEERGTGAAVFVAGYRIAMLISGGIALVLAEYLGFGLTYMLMGLCMGITMISTFLSKEPEAYSPPPPTFKSACIEPFVEFLSRKHAIALLVLVVLYKLGDAFAGNLTVVFLLRGVGFSLIDVGLINKSVGLIATLLGAFAGGVLLSKVGLYRSLLWFGVIQAISNLTYLILAKAGTHYGLMVVCIFIENFGGGLGTAAFIALLMSLCDQQYTATQYALLSALSAVGRVYVGPVAGFVVEQVGWVNFFWWTLLISAPGILLLVALRRTIEENDAQTKSSDDSTLAETS